MDHGDLNVQDVVYCVIYGGTLSPVRPGSTLGSLMVWDEEIKKWVNYRPKGKVEIWVGSVFPLDNGKEGFLAKCPNQPTPKKVVKRGGSTKKTPIKREL